MKKLPIICPKPKDIEFGDGYFNIEPNSIKINELGLPVSPDISLVQNSDFGEEEYHLEIGDFGIKIMSKNDKGAKLGFQTLRQLLIQGELPHLIIRDCPDLATRGFMLDISRCKVPTMETLAYLVDTLSLLKYNRLELYTEHTYAFSKHPLVWANASPMTKPEYEALDKLCKRAGIELVANINSLGHMERWLRYDFYKVLAESKAPFVDPMGNTRQFPTTLYPDDTAVSFINSLYSEFLPLFSSNKVNIGCDEPWELGMGRSKERCEADGSKYKLYVEYVTKLNNLAKTYGKKASIWADVIIKDKESVKTLPADLGLVLWGYDSDHPFGTQCQYLQSIGRQYLVAAGTNTWNSFVGRWQTAHENNNNACKNAKEYGASGAILTNWGDNGNHQIFSAMFLSICNFAQSAWGELSTQSEAIDAASALIYRDESKNFAKAIVALSNSDPHKSLYSLTNKLFFGTAQEVQKIIEENPMAMIKMLQACDEAFNLLKLSSPKSIDAKICIAELNLAIEMQRWAVNRAVNDVAVNNIQQQIGLKFIRSKYEQIWFARARIGGLAESSMRISKIREDIFI